MARNSAVSLSAVTGITRTHDYSIDWMQQNSVIGGALNNYIRCNRSGVSLNGFLNIYDGIIANVNGRMGFATRSGLSYGVMWQLCGMQVLSIQPAINGSLTIQQAVTRFLCSMCTTNMVTPNSDVGLDIIIASSNAAYTDLTTVSSSSTGQGKSGFAIMMKGNQWYFMIKMQNTALGIFQEATLLNWPAAAVTDCTIPVDVEFRIYDATFATPARMELYIANVLQLTRYWVNPIGVATQVLPPLFTTLSGNQLFMLHRNTSTGPTQMIFADPRIIQGPNDAGTVP